MLPRDSKFAKLVAPDGDSMEDSILASANEMEDIVKSVGSLTVRMLLHLRAGELAGDMAAEVESEVPAEFLNVRPIPPSWDRAYFANRMPLEDIAGLLLDREDATHLIEPHAARMDVWAGDVHLGHFFSSNSMEAADLVASGMWVHAEGAEPSGAEAPEGSEIYFSCGDTVFGVSAGDSVEEAGRVVGALT